MKKEQKPKPTLDVRIRAEVDRARSNAGGPHRLATRYNRKDKHKGKRDW